MLDSSRVCRFWGARVNFFSFFGIYIYYSMSFFSFFFFFLFFFFFGILAIWVVVGAEINNSGKNDDHDHPAPFFVLWLE